MNEIEYPSLASNDAVAGFVFQKQEPNELINIDQQAMEISCINLISKLENLLAKAVEMPKDDFIDESADIGRKILEALLKFSDEFLIGNAATQAKEEIDKAVTFCHAYEEVLSTRSLANSVIRTFWKIKELDEIQAAHAQLGEALTRSCAATLYHAIMQIGIGTEVGQQIDQSTVIFVSELKKSWN